MDISGPVRALLHQHLPAQPQDAFLFTARLLAQPGELTPLPPQTTPPHRPSHQHLSKALLLRALPRVGRGTREQLADLLAAEIQQHFDDHKRLLFSRTAPAVDILWLYWLLVLARARLKLPVNDRQLRILWQNAWSRQTSAGSLHPLAAGDAGGALDGAAYDDLVALHIAYNAVLFTRDYDLFPRVQKLADFLVQTAQPDHTTCEPWGLAAFAALDDTRTFAPQQLHDATTQLSTAGANPVILGLLADALMAQDEAADA